MNKAQQINHMLREVDLSARICPDCVMRLMTYEMDKYTSARDMTGLEARDMYVLGWKK